MRIRTVTKGQQGDGKFEGMNIHYRGNFAIVQLLVGEDEFDDVEGKHGIDLQIRFRALHRMEKDGYELLAADGGYGRWIFRKVGSQPDAATILLRNLAKGVGAE